MRVEHIGDATLYLGDCREILPTLGKVDAVVTDPPYGVGFKGKKTKYTKRSDGYAGYEDTPENFDAVVLPALRRALDVARRGAVFIGNKSAHKLPPPADIGGIYTPAGVGLTSWGFTALHLVMFYGVSPYHEAGKGSRPTATQIRSYPGGHKTGEGEIGHPCPKPVAYMDWVVQTASLPGELVLDPFMGSGTTGVSCLRLGRRFVGLEVHEPYFDIACRRIEEAYKQPRLFDEPPPKPQQGSIFGDDA